MTGSDEGDASSTTRGDGRADPSGMLDAVAGFPAQVEDGWRISAVVELPWERRGAVALLGMGGSAIGGDLVRGHLVRPPHGSRSRSCAATTCRPGSGRETLVIASSKSGGDRGDDQRAQRRARAPLPGRGHHDRRSARGGRRRAGLPLVTFPARGSPRSSVGLLDGDSSPALLERAGVLPLEEAEIAAAAETARAMARTLCAGRAHRREPGQAARLVARRPLRDHRRERVPGPGRAPLEGAAQRERQVGRRLRGAARGHPQHGRRASSSPSPLRDHLFVVFLTSR